MTVQQSENSKLLAVQQLREKLRTFEPRSRGQLSAGCVALDSLFPGGGIPRGGIVEWLTADSAAGVGATTLSLQVARHLCSKGGILAVVDSQRELYPPAMAAMGIDMDKAFFVHPQSWRNEIWALIQCLQCRSLPAVWGYFERIDSREYRCLQLAAEASGSVGLFVRPASARGQPTWSDAQLLVTPRRMNHASTFKRRLMIEVVHCRHGAPGGKAMVEVDEITGNIGESYETFPLRMAAELAGSSIGRSASGA